jgi:hypothetical protein
MHTENSHLCEIVTNFAGGVSALNGLTANNQYFATGTIGTNFAISSVGDTHTFNLPTASGTNRGALSSADWTTFNGKQAALTLTTTGTSGAATLVGATLNIPQYSGGGGGMAIGGSITSATAGSVLFAGASGVLQQDNANLFWDDTNNRLGIGTTAPAFTLDTRSDIVINGWVIGKGSNTSLNNLRITEQANASFNNVTTANNNIFIGRNTGLSLTTGIGNVSLGQSAGQIISSGNYNFSLGYLSAVRLQTGENNISIGTESLLYIVGQSNNIAFGFRAGAYINGYTNATPSSSIYIGNSCFSGAVTASNEIVIGNGTGTIGLGSNTTMIGNNSTVTAAIRGRLLLGTTTDSGLYQLDVNGTARVSDTFTAGTSTFTNKLNAQFGTFGIQSYAVNNGFMSDNMYYNGSSWTRLATGYGFGYQFYNGSVLFQGVNTGTGTFTPNAIMKVDYAGNFLLGQTLSATPLDFTNAKLRFTNNGRLLLGTTTESTYILDVFNTARFQDTLTIGASAFTNKLNTEIGSIGIQSFFKNNAFITDNYYYNGTTTTRTNTGYAFGMHFYNGSLSFLGANTGTGAFTPNYKFKFDYEGAFVIGDNLSLGAADYTNATALFTKNGRFLLGTTTENTSALLNVTSTTQGFLPPRMTTTQKNAIATPASGLQVYDSTLNQMSYYNGTTWINF